MALTNLKSKIRYILNDNSTTGSDIFTYTSSNIFTLSESNVISLSSVLKNDVEMGTSESSFDSTTNKVTVNLSMNSGDTIEIRYTYYPNYSDTELLNYIQATLVYLSINNYRLFEYDSTNDTIYPELELKEENLIASITSILINKPARSYRLPDITLTFAEDLSLEDKISKTIATYKHNVHGVVSIL